MDKSIFDVRPDLAEEWSEKNLPLTPQQISYGSNRKVIWKGSCGHEWIASAKSRVTNNTGCPYCSHNKVLVGFNDLASQYPEIAEEWSDKNLPLTSHDVTPFSNKRVWWHGKCGHEWYALVSSRSDGHGCPYCRDNRLLPGYNDFKTLHPDLAEEWSRRNKLDPGNIIEKKTGNFWWTCRHCGGEYQAWVSSRINGSKCPYCSDQKVLQGFNDLVSRAPEIATEWSFQRNAGVLPGNILYRAKAEYWWQSGCSHEWKSSPYERVILHRTCPTCEAEFLQSLPWLLLLDYLNRSGLKVLVNSDSLIGIPLEFTIVDAKAVYEIKATTDYQEKVQVVKRLLCLKRGFSFELIEPFESPLKSVDGIRCILKKLHIHPNTQPAEDINHARQKFELLRAKGVHTIPT